jgi:Tfp pilus assembly protein PilP
MQRLMTTNELKRAYCAGLAIAIISCLSGCQEANMAIDFIVGRQSPAVSHTPELERPPVILASRRSAGESPAPVPTAAASGAPTAKPPATVGPPAQAPKPPAAVSADQQGKRRGPGVFPPGVTAERPEQKRVREVFAIERDPFRPPTEILPTECPPSMPLCRFDRSQLKLVGIIQVGDGQFKAMVEDPDGRGYFVTSGMQIGGATVTQVSNRGVTLHLHKTQQDVLMPLFRETRETAEM